MYYKYGIRLGKNPKQMMQLNRKLIHSSDFPNSYRNFIQTCLIFAYNYDKINLLRSPTIASEFDYFYSNNIKSNLIISYFRN